MKVERDTKLPTNWNNFLGSEQNKKCLFKLLAYAIRDTQLTSHKQVVLTIEEKVVSSPVSDTEDSKLKCSHKEVDTRLIFHAHHLIENGMKNILIQATDNDVVVLAVAASSVLDCELWVAFGHGQNMRYIPCHLISEKLGAHSSKGLLFFHAFTGCDVCSSFHGIGKKTAWTLWNSMVDLHKVFANLSETDNDIVTLVEFQEVDRFTVLLYKRNSDLTCVNEMRKHLLCQGRSIENIPPTQDALKNKVHRAAYVAKFIWGQSFVGEPVVPSAGDWGWKWEPNSLLWIMNWTSLPEASKACKELIKCACQTQCRNKKCSCVKANLPCSELCKCTCQH